MTDQEKLAFILRTNAESLKQKSKAQPANIVTAYITVALLAELAANLIEGMERK